MAPLIVLEGARIEIDGTDALIILTPFGCDTEDQQEAVTIQLCALSKNTVLVFARRQADGLYYFFPPGPLQEKLQAKSGADLHWTKIPVFPPDNPFGSFNRE